MNIINQLALFFKKYLAQILVMVIGLLIILAGSQKDEATGLQQNILFTLGGVGMLIAGIISTLYVAGIIQRMVHTILMLLVLPALLIYYTFADYHSIQDEIDWRNTIALHEKEVIQRLKDLREAELEFRNTYGRFTGDFDTLKNFVREGKSVIVIREGDIPQKISLEQAKALGMKDIPTEVITEAQAWTLAQKGMLPGFKRDSTYLPVMDKLFSSEKALASRNSMYKFNVDSMDIAPFTGGKEKFILQVDRITKNDILIPVILIEEPKPITKKKLFIGSLTEVTTNGNWGE